MVLNVEQVVVDKMLLLLLVEVVELVFRFLAYSIIQIPHLGPLVVVQDIQVLDLVQLHYSGLLAVEVQLALLVEGEVLEFKEELLMVHIMDMLVLVMELLRVVQLLSLMLHKVLVVVGVEEIRLREVVQVVPVLSSLHIPPK